VSDGVADAQIGDTVTYRATLQNTRSGSTAAGARMSLTVPSNLTVLDADGATVDADTLNWDLGDLPGGQSITRTVRTQLTSGNVGDSFGVTVLAQTDDDACGTPGSMCSAIDTDQIGSAPTTKEYVANPGFEANKVGWTGVYNSSSTTARYAQAHHDGGYSLKITRSSRTSGAAGLVSRPSWVPSTTANAGFTAGSWVRGQRSGQSQTVVVQINEVNPAGTVVGSAVRSVSFSDLAWHQVQVPYTCVGTGDHLDFVVYSPSLGANAEFLTDTESLVGPQT
jgi:uncharacterized repeat protein (TIGR01451 family)